MHNKHNHCSHNRRATRVVPYLIFVGLLALVCSPAVSAQCDANQTPQLITFSEYPTGTSITTQYQALGAVFASGTGAPFITTDGSNPTSPVLSGTPLFQGPITVTFVDPNNPAVGALATNVELDAGYFDNLDSVSITYFDMGGNALGSIANSAFGIEHFTT